MESFSKSVVENKTYQLFYFALILILLIIIVWYNKKPENLTGTGLGTGGAYYGSTSGATMRVAAQGFSQPGQGDRDTTYIPDIKEAVPGYIKSKKESLVDTAQGPMFMEIGNELEAYQQEAGREKEELVDGSPMARAEEARLYGKLHPF